MVLGAALLVGSSLLAMILAGISMLFPSKEPEMIEEQPAKETPVIKIEAPAVEEAAPGAVNSNFVSADFGKISFSSFRKSRFGRFQKTLLS